MTARADLLALTADDLADITSRGAVKRALRELDAGEPLLTIASQNDGTVLVECSDGTVVTLPAGVPVQDAPCTCDAIGCCRHVARAVLAYGRRAGEDASEAATTVEADAADATGTRTRRGADGGPGATGSGPAGQPWDPGTFSDDELAAALRPAILRRGRTLAAGGVTATVVRAVKPVALLHEQNVAVRFLVPGELSYARCDCVDAPPCEHVVAAVHAFRALGGERDAGVVEISRPAAASAADGAGALQALEAALALLAEAGLATGRDAPRDALRHAERSCRAAGLTWPADICAELADLCERHARADGTFEPLRAAQLAGEALLRADALRARTGAVPQLFAAGPRSAAETVVGAGRLVGIGTRVRDIGRTVDIDALVYDTAGHRLLTLGRTFHEPDADGAAPPRSFADLAAATLQRAITIAAAGAGQLVATGGARSPAGRLRLGRRPAALSAQRFEWAGLLRAPVLVESAAEARGVAGAALPAPLSPRTAGAAVVVLEIASIAEAGFHLGSGSIVAHALDAHGAAVVIAHPFTSRAAGGSERLLAQLGAIRDGSAAARFVAGEARIRGAETVIHPIGLVVENAGGHRELVQPWIDRGDSARGETLAAETRQTPPGEMAVAEIIHDVQAHLGALFVTGVARADRTVREAWAALALRAGDAGSVVLADAIDRVAAMLGARAHDARWEPAGAVAALLDLAPAVELARAL